MKTRRIHKQKSRKAPFRECSSFIQQRHSEFSKVAHFCKPTCESSFWVWFAGTTPNKIKAKGDLTLNQKQDLGMRVDDATPLAWYKCVKTANMLRSA